jgi:hypothetical protein
MKAHKDELSIAALYVDDLIFMSNSQRLIDKFKKVMKLKFDMTNLRIKQEKLRIFVSQGAYVRKILHKFRIKYYNSVATMMEFDAKLSKLEGGETVDSNIYRSMIESLRYLTCMISDITFVVGVASRFMKDLRYSHLKAVKKILRYINRIEDLRLFYHKLQIMWTTII